MKKITSLILALVLAFSLVSLSACGGKATDDKNSDSADDKVITVGASATPHAEILEQIKQALADEGYELKIVTYDDYVLPNQALADGTLDANYFQHKPYLDSFNAKNGTSLVSAGIIHYEPFGIYGNGVTDLKGLAKGATIIIPADDSNETRALFLLQQEGLIKLPDDADAAKGVSTLDIVDDGGYNIVTVQADTVPAQLKNASAGTIAVINGNYAGRRSEDQRRARHRERRRHRRADLRQHHRRARRRREQPEDAGAAQGAQDRRRQAVHRRHLQRRCRCKLLSDLSPLFLKNARIPRLLPGDFCACQEALWA